MFDLKKLRKILRCHHESIQELICDLKKSAAGYMAKSVYDTTDSGIVDDAEKVNGKTVGVNVPTDAVFTDTVYNDTTIQAAVALNTAKEGITDAFKAETTITDASGTINIDWSLFGRYNIIQTGNITINLINYSDYAVSKVQDIFINADANTYTITWKADGVAITPTFDTDLDFSSSTNLNCISLRCLIPSYKTFQFSNYLIS